MPTDCPYCGDPIPDDSYERHLRRTHADELTPIDRRRVGQTDSTRGRPWVRYAGVAGVVLLLALGYALVFVLADTGPGPSAAAVDPDPTNETHEHGLLTVQYDDTVVDLTDPQYLEADDCFHFHGDENETSDSDGSETAQNETPPGAQLWHTHCGNVTVEYALETLGMAVTADGVTVDGQEFSEADGDEVSVTVDGDPVDPREYVLHGVEPTDAAREGAGDDVEVVLRSGDGADDRR